LDVLASTERPCPAVYEVPHVECEETSVTFTVSDVELLLQMGIVNPAAEPDAHQQNLSIC
jgi:hypothetical protein